MRDLGWVSVNRAEKVRQIPPGDPDFETLYRRRNDVDGINRHLDDTLWLLRAHSVGNRRQLLNMITYALGVNALSMYVHARPRPTTGRLNTPNPLTSRRTAASRIRRIAGATGWHANSWSARPLAGA